MLKEFKEFALRGNVLDLAIGVVIGATFGSIVSSLVDDIIMPLVGVLLGGVDFKNLSVGILNAEIMYGSFIQAVVDFLIIAFSIFLFVKLVNRYFSKKEEEVEEEEEVDQSEVLLTEIRDLLKEQNQ